MTWCWLRGHVGSPVACHVLNRYEEGVRLPVSITTKVLSRCSRCGHLFTSTLDGAWTAEQLSRRLPVKSGAVSPPALRAVP